MHAKNCRLGRKITQKIADCNSLIIKQRVDRNGTIDKQNIWKVKRAIGPKDIEIAYSLRSSDGNDISDLINIKCEYRRSFNIG